MLVCRSLCIDYMEMEVLFSLCNPDRLTIDLLIYYPFELLILAINPVVYDRFLFKFSSITLSIVLIYLIIALKYARSKNAIYNTIQV